MSIVAPSDDGWKATPLKHLERATGGTVDFRPDALHGKFMDAFNNRQWEDVKALLAEDSVFHRSGTDKVYSGPDQVIGRFEDTIGSEWNIKFVRLDSSGHFSGGDGRVVERDDFAITAGADDSSCYAGSFMMTWVPQEDESWELQWLAWQDLETDLANCK